MDLYLCENTTRREDAYALLAHAVRRRWGLDTLPVMARGEHGKPYFPAFPQYHFNLSHSGSLALCALDERSVGADIEVIRPHHPKLAQRICSRSELAWLEGQEDKISALCQLWTRKEALVKHRGTGLTVPLRSIRVPLPPAAEQDGLHFYSLATAQFCLCACGHAPASSPVLVDAQEISR